MIVMKYKMKLCSCLIVVHIFFNFRTLIIIIKLRDTRQLMIVSRYFDWIAIQFLVMIDLS